MPLFQTKQPLQEQTAKNNTNNEEQLRPSPLVVAALSSSTSLPWTRTEAGTTKATDDNDDSSQQQQQQHVVVVQTVQSPPHDSHDHDHDDPNATNNNATHHHRHHDDDHDDHHRLHRWQAMMHLIKGNLGPGCLNLPAAFKSTGWALAVALFALVACQGIYSMWLLVQCKRALQQQRRHPQQSSPPQTFMQVAHVALGRVGSRTTELFLFILQTGVCCVFLSLVQTNLAVAVTALSDGTATALVTCILMAMTVLRFLTDLTWTSTTANVVMMVTIATAATAGWQQYIQNKHDHDNDNDTSRNTTTTPAVIVDPNAIIQFFPAMFFAFEGLGLVLPIENAYATTTTTSTTTTTRTNNTHTISSTSSTCSFETVLIQSMCITAALFVTVGVFASMGFDDLQEGSVTAYLQATFPHNTWYAALNAAVMVAVLLTFPLQLQPAMQVLDQWLDQDLTFCRQGRQTVRPGVLPLATTEEQAQQTEQQQQAAIGHDHGDRHDNDNDDGNNDNDLPLTIPAVRMELPHQESTGNFQLMERTHSQDELDRDLFHPKDTNNRALAAVDHEPDGLVRVGYYSSSGSSTTVSSFLDPLDATWCCGIPQWLVRRWIVVLACAVIVLWTDDLSLLIGIFGAIGQTGLAAMPCAIDLALQYQGVVPYSWWKTCLHAGILLFCVAVMISSLAAYAR